VEALCASADGVNQALSKCEDLDSRPRLLQPGSTKVRLIEGIASPAERGQGREMGDLVNLNKARKAKARSVARATAEANRAKFGRTGAEKDRDRIEMARAEKRLDGHRLETD
jgi:hypothetical protein